METSASVVLVFVLATMLSGWSIFDGARMARPVLGVISLADTMVMLGAVVLAPLVYLRAPTALVSGLFLLAAASSLYALGSAICHSQWAVWSTMGAVLLADVLCAVQLGTHHPAFWIVNDSVCVAVAASVGALWVQSGLRARDAAVLTLSIALYDLVATGVLPLTDLLLARLASMPVVPLVGWGPVSVGLGDLLIATMVPLAYRKAFGDSAGIIAMATGLLIIIVALVVHMSGPLMVSLGPPLAAQYLAWRCWKGPERTSREYLIRKNAGPPRGRLRRLGVQHTT